MIHYRENFSVLQKNAYLPQYATICCNWPQFATICSNLLQFATIWHNLPLNPCIFLWHGTVFEILTLAPPFIVVENNHRPKMGGSH
jgi:hypothetical protein